MTFRQFSIGPLPPAVLALGMADSLSPADRSRRMSLIGGKNTKPELVVRRLLHGMGYRYRLHGRGLPGKPDIVLKKYKTAIFVHGCFWHRHENKHCKLARLPKSRLDFWIPKLEGNKIRDRENRRKLASAGWRTLTVWECQLKNIDALTQKLAKFLRKGN